MQFLAVRRRVATLRALDRPIAVLAAIAFISQVGVSIMLPLLPLFAVQLGATPGQLGLMVSIFAVTNAVGQLGSGVMISRISARRQMPLGQASYAAANLLIATATSAVPLIAFRGLAGFGGGLSIVAERLYIARVADRARLAFTNGIVSAAGSSGSVLGPTIGALLAVSDLKVPFLVVGGTATVAAIAAILFLPPEPVIAPAPAKDPAAEGSDSGFTAAGPSRWTRMEPLVRIFIWNLAFNAAFGAWITTFAPYATQNLFLQPSLVALMFAFFGIGAIVLGPALARIADRSGRRRMVAFGSVLVLGNIAALAAGAPVAVIYASAILAGGGLAGAQSSWFALLGVATDGGRRGRSFGFVTAFSNLGIVVGATLAAAVWDQVGLREAVIVAGGFLALATASVLLMPREHGPDRLEGVA